MCLLEALVVHVLPDMSPGSEASGNVRLDGQHDHASAEAAGAHKADGGEIARTQVRDDEERHEEHKCGAEVVLQRETAAADGGQTDEHPQVALVEQAVERCGTGENIADFRNFRGLQRQRAETQPCLRAASRRADQQCNSQQSDCRCAHKPAHLLRPGQVAQEEAEHDKDSKAHQNRNQLLGQLVRHGRAGDGE